MSFFKKRLLSFTEKQLQETIAACQEMSILNDTRVSGPVAGTIETLQMTNFMCHSNLELKFNSRINFITGRNGSGKSAIMAALIVVLGGSASSTGRGSGVTDLIKKGETWAKVVVTIVNEGVNAYKKDTYGNRIIICRNLSKTSSNTYTCKSQWGAVVSRKKEEVDNIVLSLNLQIKNPVCILNQDVARNFLCSTDTSLRFTMFAKATQLEHLKSIYIQTLELLVVAKKQLKIKERGIEEASREINQLKEKLAVFASLEKHVHERTKLENEYLWSLVVDEETKLKDLGSEKIELEQKKIEYLEGEINFQRAIKDLENEVKAYEEKILRVKTSRSEKSGEKHEIEKAVQNVERDIEKTQMMIRQLMAKVERQLIDINAVKEHLAQNDSIVSQNQAERDAANQKIKGLKEELSYLKNSLTEIQVGYNEAQECKSQRAKYLENIRSELVESEQNIKRLEILLTGAKARSQNDLLKFGPFTPELVSAIEEAAKKNQFVKKPVGPCGLYVNLSGDAKWARAVESVIGGLMTTYCCDNQKDFQTLTRIMDKICGNKQPPIIISKFLQNRHNVASQKVFMTGFQSVLDVLSFDNDVVFNTFIDQARIETILLFETDHQAASVLTHVQNVPKNLRMGLTLQSDQYYPAPNYRTYYGDSKRPLKYFDGGSKTGDSITKIERDLKEANAIIHEKNVAMARARKDYIDACDTLKMYEKKMKELKQSERKIQLEINHLKDIEDSRPVLITKVALEEELQTLQKGHEESNRKASEYKESLTSLMEKKEELLMSLNSVNSNDSHFDKNFRKLEEKLDRKRFKLKQMTGKIRGTTNQISKIDQKLNDIIEEIRVSQSCLAAKIKSAEDVCQERVITERSAVEVQRLLEKCERYLKAAEKMAGSRQGTIAEYKTKMELFNKMRKTEGVLASAMETLTRVALKKEQRLNVLQSHTASLVSFYFQATLQTRGYDGQLKVNFDEKVLDIEVKPKDGTVARKDSKTLSGGERSYSTVSFILAIWKVVQMPIYCLDEFDVFMDKVNRKVIMDLLLEHASFQSDRQYMFITPQEISNIHPSDIISIFKLPDPERKKV